MALGLGSISSLGIGLAVFMDDQFTGVANNVGASLSSLNTNVNTFNQSMARLQTLGSGMAAVGDRIIAGATAGVVEFAKFDDVMNSVRSIGQFENDPMGMAALTEQAKTLGGIYGQMPVDIANAQLELAKGGKSQADILKMTEATVALGAGGEIGVAGRNGGAEVLLNIMQGYNASADQAMHFADVITSAAQRSTIDVTDFYLSMQYGAQAARALHIPLEQTAAAIAVLGNAGFKGSKSGVAYQNMLTYLSKAVGQFGSKRQKEALDILGIGKEDVVNAQGELINLSQLMELFKRQTEGMSGMKKLDVFQAIFGVRGDRGVEPLMMGQVKNAQGQMISALDDMQNKINEDSATSVATKIALGKTDDLMGDWEKFTSGWSSFKISIGSAFEGVLRGFLPILTSILLKITDLFNGDFGKWMVRSGVFMGAALSLIGRLIIGGARMMIYVMTSAGRMRTTFTMAEVASGAIKLNFIQGATAIRNAMLLARGVSIANMGSAGQMLRSTATGRLMGRSNALTRNLAMFVGGRSAIRFAQWIERIGVMLAPWFGWLAKTGVIFKAIGGILGTVVEWLFGWEAMLVDLVVTMVTGKGVFEWLWTALKSFGRWLGLWGGDDDKKVAMETYDAKRDYQAETRLSTTPGGGGGSYNQQMMDKLARDKQNQTIHITVNPTTGDQRTERKINLNSARQLQSNAIN
jgi:TP901 family phage tail tape measure protein